MKKAVVLLSGGLDSSTVLYLAKKRRFKCFCLMFDYGQKHTREINSARRIAQKARCDCKIAKFSLPWKGSSLLDKRITMPRCTSRRRRASPIRAGAPEHQSTRTPEHQSTRGIPNTYVPARNTIFLSLALSYAEAVGAEAIFIGANQIDFSGYPDCRLEYYRCFQKVINKGTKAGIEGKRIKIYTPLMNKSKAEIIKLGLSLEVPFELTWSCYEGRKKPCGRCDSCLFRAEGFRETGTKDPLLYIQDFWR